MGSPHSGLLANVLVWGCLYREDLVVPLGAFGVGTGVAGLALGVAALPVLGVCVCVRGDWFPPVKCVAGKFMVFTHCLSGLWLVGIGFSLRLRFRYGWCGCSVVGLGSLGVTLGVFLVHCILCCVGGFYPACWRGRWITRPHFTTFSCSCCC